MEQCRVRADVDASRCAPSCTLVCCFLEKGNLVRASLMKRRVRIIHAQQALISILTLFYSQIYRWSKERYRLDLFKSCWLSQSQLWLDEQFTGLVEFNRNVIAFRENHLRSNAAALSVHQLSKRNAWATSKQLCSLAINITLFLDGASQSRNHLDICTLA